MMFLHLMYCKEKHSKPHTHDKEILHKVGYKVEDLELKVNILTYKMQYGTWPLPHQIKSGLSRGFRNVRLTSSSPNDYNDRVKDVSLRKDSKVSKSENLELKQYQNVILSENTRSVSKKLMCKKSSSLAKNLSHCEKYAKTLDECKWFLKQLHNSNKSLGLVCSSSEISEASFSKNTWPKDQATLFLNYEDAVAKDANSEIGENVQQTPESISASDEAKLIDTNIKDRLSAEIPIKKLVNSCPKLVSPQLDIALSADLLPQQLRKDFLIPSAQEQNKSIEKSEETLVQVKKKLESLHNVLQLYELQNAQVSDTRKGVEYNEMQNVSYNIMHVLTSIVAEIENINGKRRSKVNFKIGTQKCKAGSQEHGTDDTDKTSVTIIHCIPDAFEQRHSVIHHSSQQQGPHLSNDLRAITMPERSYYNLDHFSKKNREDILENLNVVEKHDYIENAKVQSSCCTDYSTPMDAQEDLLSPNSSQTESSMNSESDETSTAILLQKALQFKKALLLRAGMLPCEKLSWCNIQEGNCNSSQVNDESVLDHKYINIDSNPSSKLDILTEEQSCRESINQTYVYCNSKKELSNHSVSTNKDFTEFRDENKIESWSPCKKYDSNDTLENISSEYLSVNNIVLEKNIDGEAYLSKEQGIDETKTMAEMVDNIKIDDSSINILKKESDENLKQESSSNINEFCVDGFTVTNNVNEDPQASDHYNSPKYTELYVFTSDGNNLVNQSQMDISLNSNEMCAESIINVNCESSVNLKRNPGMCSLLEETENIINSTNLNLSLLPSSTKKLDEIELNLGKEGVDPVLIKDTIDLEKAVSSNENYSAVTSEENTNYDTDIYKSSCNLITAHSDIYFTGDDSKSKIMLNNSLSKNDDRCIKVDHFQEQNKSACKYAVIHETDATGPSSSKAYRSSINENRELESTEKPVGVLDRITGKSDSLRNVQLKSESNRNFRSLKTRDLSLCTTRNSRYNCNNLCRKRSLSEVNMRTNDCILKNITPRSYESSPYSKTSKSTTQNKLKENLQLKSSIPTREQSSRSCIPILKSRLEAVRYTRNELRSKSPMRGPLTVTMLWRDNLHSKNSNINEEIIRTEGSLRSKNQYAESPIENNLANNRYSLKCNMVEAIDRTHTDRSTEPMVIYVNIFTKCDNAVTGIVDPNKFLEYAKCKGRNRRSSFNESLTDKAQTTNANVPLILTEKDGKSICKTLTIASSVIDENDANKQSCTSARIFTMKKMSIDPHSKNTFKKLYLLTVEQREADITAKPSVVDTSTSISDLAKDIPRISEDILNKFQIYEIPKELSNEEYVALLEILHQEPNLSHLQELQNLCTVLISKYQDKK